MDYKDFITNTLKKAGVISLKYFSKVEGTEKIDDINQVYTIADLEIGKIILDEINRNYPNDNTIDEELGGVDKGSNITWVVDPIDGSSNYLAGLPFFGIMIGVLKDDIPFAGGVYLPKFDELYFAQKGFGSFCNDNPIKVTKEKELSKLLIAYGIDSNKDTEKTLIEATNLAKIVLSTRNVRLTNCVFDAMMVAKGSFGGYLNRSSKIWDNIAPEIIITEAGGIYTDFNGLVQDYSNPFTRLKQNFEYIAAPIDLHSKIFEIIKTKFI